MKKNQSNQYTIRSIPNALDRQLRSEAKKNNVSLNEVVIETLKRGSGLGDTPVVYDDLDVLIGTWKNDPGFDEAVSIQRSVELEAWE
jgi:hypothetical protein